MTDEKRFPGSGVLRVNVELETGDIDANWTETDEVVVRGDVDASYEADEIFVTAMNDRRSHRKKVELQIPVGTIGGLYSVKRGDVHLINPQGKIDVQLDSGDAHIDRGTGTLSVAVGKGDSHVSDYAGEVIANNGSGDSILNGIGGDVTVRSGKGDVHLTGGDGRTTVAVGSGDIHLKDRDCNELALAGGSGDITITGGRLGRGSVTTASGDIHCQAALSLATYDFTTSSGDISVSIPRDLAARVDVATSRGDVSTDLPLVTIAQRGPRNPHGKRLVGSTSNSSERADITLRTSSGDIGVRWGSNSSAQQPGQGMNRSDRGIDVRSGSDTDPDTSRQPETVSVTSGNTERETTASAPAVSTNSDDRKRAILSALADGAISTEEAGMLLDALNRTLTGSNGA